MEGINARAASRAAAAPPRKAAREQYRARREDARRPASDGSEDREGRARPEAVDLCRMLGLALLEMARFVLCRRATARLVRALHEALRQRRDQRILLLVADGCQRPGLAAAAG